MTVRAKKSGPALTSKGAFDSRPPLEGRGVRLSIGEPWDFESSDGPNVLAGRVAAEAPDAPADELTIAVTPFDLGDDRIEQLSARARYEADNLRHELLAEGCVPANFTTAGRHILTGSIQLVSD